MVKSAGLSEKLWLWCFVFTALIMFSVWKLLLLVWRHSVFSPTPLMLLHFISLCQHHPTHSQVYVWGLLSSALWKDRKERKKWDVSVAVNNNITTRTQLKWDECRRWTWKHFFPYYSFTSCCHYCVKHHSGNWFFPVGAKQAGGVTIIICGVYSLYLIPAFNKGVAVGTGTPDYVSDWQT